MDLDAHDKLELVTRHLEQFSLELGRHCAGLRLAVCHFPPPSSPLDSGDSRCLLELLTSGLSDLHMRMEEELSLLLRE